MVQLWQGDPFHKKVHATDSIFKHLPRSEPAGSLSNFGYKNFKEEVLFEICENNVRNFIFTKLKRSSISIHKKIRRDIRDKNEIKVKMEIWNFTEEIFKLLITRLLEWDWENPNLLIFKDCYDHTLSKKNPDSSQQVNK